MKTTTFLTHNGKFHGDDAVAAAIGAICFRPFEILRTRNKEVIESRFNDPNTWIVDVGYKYDPTLQAYDHHQPDFKEVRENGMPYASAGLIWRALGQKAIETLAQAKGIDLSFDEMTDVWRNIDEEIITHVDATDVGYAPPPPKPRFAGIKEHYELGAKEEKFKYVFNTEPVKKGLSLSGIISAANPNHLEEAAFDAQFETVVYDVVAPILQRAIFNEIAAAIGERLVTEALETRSDPRIVVLPKFIPWVKTVTARTDTLMCVFPAEDGSFQCQVVPKAPGSFEARKSLPKSWAGLRDADLDAVTAPHGVAPGAVFCHRGRFICGHKAKEGALAMAKVAAEHPLED